MGAKLIAEYTPQPKSRFVLQAMWAAFLGVCAFALYCFFTFGGFALADWFLGPVGVAALMTGTFLACSVRRCPTISLYENGLVIDGALTLWSEIESVRYRRYENFWNRVKYEWIVQARNRRHRFSMIAPDLYIDQAKLNSAFSANVEDFRNTSRLWDAPRTWY